MNIIDIKNEIISNAVFPKMNKNDSLEEYRFELGNGSRREKIIIKRIILMNEIEWANIIENNLLSDNEIWDKIGGSILLEKDYDFFIKKYGTEWEKGLFNNEEKIRDFRNLCYTQCIQVINISSQKIVYINTEGYDYARYLGF